MKEQQEHYMTCSVCGEPFDMRDLTQVLYHEVHKPVPVISHGKVIFIGTKFIEGAWMEDMNERGVEIRDKERIEDEIAWEEMMEGQRE